MPPARFVTQREIARFFGVSQQTVSRWKLEYDEDGCYGLQRICQLLARQRGGDVVSARDRLDQAKADQAELDLERSRGKVVDREAARQQFAAIATSIREGVLDTPGRLARDLAAEDDAAAVARLLTAELTRVLDRLAADPVEP